MVNNTRDNYIDLLKGIGIICVVFAHSIKALYDSAIIRDIHRFIYIFHLPLFFFVSGYLSNPNKTIKQLAKSILKTYLALLCSCLVILIFVSLYENHSILEITNNIYSILTIQYISTCRFAYALWFVPCLLISKIIFQIILWLSNLNIIILKNKSFLLTTLLSLFISFVGIVFSRYHILSFWNISISMCMILVMYFGMIYKKYRIKIDSFLSNDIYIYIFIFLISIFAINKVTGLEIALDCFKLYGYYALYPMILLGLLFCISFAQKIMKNNRINEIFQACGNSSYYIMAYHFTVFCIIDITYIKAFNIKENILFPTTFPLLIPFYTVLGCLVPICISRLIEYITNKFKTKSSIL